VDSEAAASIFWGTTAHASCSTIRLTDRLTPASRGAWMILGPRRELCRQTGGRVNFVEAWAV
jgi:hypothetical protein